MRANTIRCHSNTDPIDYKSNFKVVIQRINNSFQCFRINILVQRGTVQVHIMFIECFAEFYHHFSIRGWEMCCGHTLGSLPLFPPTRSWLADPAPLTPVISKRAPPASLSVTWMLHP